MISDLFVIIMDNHPKTSIFISRYAFSGKGSRAPERSGQALAAVMHGRFSPEHVPDNQRSYQDV
jgi:hypothetical protein